ncbi:MAG: MMPL family transporter [Verrucomicrobia bacterium]|nr:MMPL family transporter [Verrucomicrobiota bacterium]
MNVRPPLLVRLLSLLATQVIRHPQRFVLPQVVLFGVAVWVTATGLKFDMDRANLLGAEQRYHRVFQQYERDFGAGQDIVVVAESEDVERNRQFVERLAARMEAEPGLFTNVFFKGDLKLMGPKALLLVTNVQTLVEMEDALTKARPMLETISQVTNLPSLFRVINREFRAAATRQVTNAPPVLEALPALTRIMHLTADAIERPGVPPSPGIEALFSGAREAESSLYITFASNRLYLVTCQPAARALAVPAIERLRELIAQTKAEVPGLNVGLTGEPVLEFDEMNQARDDSILASLLSLVICGALFIYAYRETGRPLKAMICLVVGLGYTLGFATLAVGHLNLLTVTFLPILVGLAIDFGIHLVTRYEEELRHGRPVEEALRTAMVFTGKGIFTGCFTTAGAFFAMGFTDFKGIREMGLISGAGLLICLVPMMTLLPALLLRGRQNVLDHQPRASVDPRARLERLWLERPGLVIGASLTLAAVALWHVPRVSFDYNLLNLQSKGLPAVEYERKLIDVASRSVIFGAIIADSPERAAELTRHLEALPSVASVDQLGLYLAEDQTDKLAAIGRIKEKLADLAFAPVDPEPARVAELRIALQILQTYLRLGSEAAEREGEHELSDGLDDVRAAVSRLRRTMANADPEVVERRLTEFQRAFLKDLRETLVAIRDQDNRAPLGLDDLPATLRNRFVSKSGDRFLLQVNPRKDVWQREHQVEFVRDLRSVDPDATGPPVQLYEYTTLLKESYEQAAYYALGAIAVLVLVHFRSLTCVLLALLPVGLGSLWVLGWMGWTGLRFNPANIMTLPLVVGIGVTNGIHILNRFAEERNPGILAKSTGKAVLLSALTTVAGFGSLTIAKHQGIASLGLLMAAGAFACMVAGLVFLPTLLNWLCRRGWRMAGLRNGKPGGNPAGPPPGSGGTEA